MDTKILYLIALVIVGYTLAALGLYLIHRMFKQAFALNIVILILLLYTIHWYTYASLPLCILLILPLFLITIIIFGVSTPLPEETVDAKYQLKIALANGSLQLQNIRRGVSITGAAGSGKTESVVFNFLKHFSKKRFCGVVYDYKNFELTELAYPLLKDSDIPFYIISFDPIYHRVNPIAPNYLPDEESVNEISRVLMENLLEQNDQFASGSTKFFNDAVEGILSGLIWKLRTYHPEFCTLPHLIALYQLMDSDQLISFLSSDFTSRTMADAFITGVDSDRQTAAVRGTLANAFKKISTRKIFFCLSGNDVPLDLNNPQNPAVLSVVNNPKLDSAYSPVIAAIIHTVVKQMSIRNRLSSFLLLEEAPTIRLLNMHRIPATLRSYDVTTIYIMQDKIQNDLLYGEKASKAILSNLSYQFFGKANDPATAKYYEQFFELVDRNVISVSKGENLSFDTRITKTKREVSKLRANLFFRLKPGEFVAFSDGKEQLVKFKKEKLQKALPGPIKSYSEQNLDENYRKIYSEIRDLIMKLNK